MKENHVTIVIGLFLLLITTACKTDSKSEDSENTKTQSEKSISNIKLIAQDSLEIAAVLYHVSDDAPSFVLCHQARFNKSAYRETAQILTDKGYNCIAIDQRSGGELNGVKNKTNVLAESKGLSTGYLDAEPDINAAVNYMSGKYDRPIILMGSSYSASLALKVAKENENVKAVLSFSPGEYFGNELNLSETISGSNKPTFITSSKSESIEVQTIVNAVDSTAVTHFIPTSEGIHGAKALWQQHSFSKEYWTAVNEFLDKHGL